MAVLWQQSTGGFVAHRVAASATAQTSGTGGVSAGGVGGLRCAPFRAGGRPGCALFVPGDSSARLNGTPVIGGVRVLQHKDEIVIGAEHWYFSAESTPVVEPYRADGAPRQARCPICRGGIQDGQAVVRCPGCGRHYHQIAAAEGTPAKGCWTYASHCRFCEHPTSLSGEPTWRPDLEDGVQ